MAAPARVDSAGSVAAFMLERQRAHHEHRQPRCYGRSSDALVLYALGYGARPQTPGWTVDGCGFSWHGDECGTDYPHDHSDLLACEITYGMAPPALRERMEPVLREFRAWVNDRLNRYGAPHPYVKPDALASFGEPA